MDWDVVVERNREALKRILAMLVAMAGGEAAFTSRLWVRRSDDRRGRREASGGGSDLTTTPTRPSHDGRPPHKGEVEAVPTLPRRLHRVILRLLRPAEAAARRLVIVAARDLVVPPRKAETRPRPPKPRPVPIFVRPGSTRSGIVLPYGVKPGDVLPGLAGSRNAPRSLALPLTDRLPRRDSRRRVPARAMPRISIPGLTERLPLPRPPAPDDPLDATRLALRLGALGRALDDLPREALRFARWRARAEAAAAQITQTRDAAGVKLDPRLHGAGARNRKGRRRFPRLSPLRPGRPPGSSRRRPTHEVHDVLADLHHFARLALQPFQQECEAALRPEFWKNNGTARPDTS